MRTWIPGAALVLLLSACGGEKPPAPAKPAPVVPQGPLPPGAMEEAVRRFEEESGAKGQPVPDLEGCRQFSLPTETVEKSLESWTRAYLERGVYLFRRDSGFGRQPDVLVLMPTSEKYEVLRRVGTDAANYDRSNEDVIAWLREMEREHPFLLTGAGLDFLEGEFLRPPGSAESAALAKRMYEFCPDIVDQGCASVDALAAELRKGHLYLWWD